jgi:hypothetical protein
MAERYKTTEGLNIGGWPYVSEEQMRFAFICSSEGFGLPAFDAFIDEQQGAYKIELLEWRARAFAAYRAGNRAALRGWLQAAWVSWSRTLERVHIRPTLARGHKFTEIKRGRNALYRLAAEILSDYGADYPARQVLSVLESLVATGHPTVQEIDDRYIYWSDDKGREQKTTFHSFESNLSTLRKNIK